MTDDDITAYDAAAAKLQSALQAVYPRMKWRVPNTLDALFSSAINEAVHTGWLYVYVTHDGYGACVPVTIGVADEPDLLRHVRQMAIDTMERARLDKT